MKKNGFLKKLLMGVAVSLLTISIVGFLTTLSKSLFGSDTESCEHLAVTSSTVVKPATCTEDGEYRFTCSDCGEYVYKTVPASHKLKTTKGTPATCTEDGTTDSKRCTVCDEVFVEMTSIPATGHKGELGENCETCGEKIVLIPEDATLTPVSVGEKVAGKTYRIAVNEYGSFSLSNGDNTLSFWVGDLFYCCDFCNTSTNLPFIYVEGVEGNSRYVDVTFVEGVDYSHTCLHYPDGLNFAITSETTISAIYDDLTIYRAEKVTKVEGVQKALGKTYRIYYLDTGGLEFSNGTISESAVGSGALYAGQFGDGIFNEIQGEDAKGTYIEVSFPEGKILSWTSTPVYDDQGEIIDYERTRMTIDENFTISTSNEIYLVEFI